MPPKRRKPRFTKRSIVTIAIIAVFLSYAAYVLWTERGTIATPSPSSFSHEAWMSFVAPGALWFRLMNVPELNGFSGLFLSNILLSVADANLNITVSDAVYGLEVETSDYSAISVIAVNATTLYNVNRMLSNSNLTSTVYNGVTIFRINPYVSTSAKFAYVMVYNGAVVYCEGNETVLQDVEAIVDASGNDFFSSDQYKVGYMLARRGDPLLAFSYIGFVENDQKIKWAMISASGASDITRWEIFNFASEADVASQKDAVIQNYLAGREVYTSSNFILGKRVYESPDVTDIRTIIMGM